MVMFRKFIIYAFLVSIIYIVVVAYLGFVIRDDFFALTFPSWPFLINCFENCGYKIVIALFTNGLLVGILAFVLMCVLSLFIMFIKKFNRSFANRK